MSAALSQQYGTAVLVRFIDGPRTNDALTGEPAILLMDNYSSQRTPGALTILREYGHPGSAQTALDIRARLS
jgi:hypothetical protein